MRKLQVLGLLLLVLVLSSVALKAKKQFNDGIYTGESQSRYTSEPFWGQATVEIKNDKIVKLTFRIVDKEKNEIFGPDYEQHFKDNAEYAQQCRNEVNAMKVYTDKFMATKNMQHVDAITGATWSYNIFRDALSVTLEKARVK
jgi:major membrane immunogen (membrane-anchored lipoprotein)